MILVARAPFCLTLGGKGTDAPDYVRRYGGLMLNATIGFYVYSIISPDANQGVQIVSSDYRLLSHRPIREDLIGEDSLSLPRAITYYFNIRDGINVFLASQIPPENGMGFSGSMTAALIKGLAFWSGLDLGPTEVADLADTIIGDKLKLWGNRHVHHAIAFGGFNYIRLSKGSIEVMPLRLSSSAWQILDQGVLLFSLGRSFPPSEFKMPATGYQVGREAFPHLHAIKGLAQEIGDALAQADLDALGHLLDRSWREERTLMPATLLPWVDHCYEVARRNGASGGRATWGKEGGFLLLCCDAERREALIAALQDLGLVHYAFRFVQQGVEVLPWMESLLLQGWPRQVFATQDIVG